MVISDVVDWRDALCGEPRSCYLRAMDLSEPAMSILKQAAEAGGHTDVSEDDPRLIDLADARRRGLVLINEPVGPWVLPGTLVTLTNAGRAMFGLKPIPKVLDWLQRVL